MPQQVEFLTAWEMKIVKDQNNTLFFWGAVGNQIWKAKPHLALLLFDYTPFCTENSSPCLSPSVIK